VSKKLGTALEQDTWMARCRAGSLFDLSSQKLRPKLKLPVREPRIQQTGW